MENNNIIRAGYDSDKYGYLRIAYLIDKNIIFYCAKDVAKMFGFRDPSRSVRDNCKTVKKISHYTHGGYQVLNFINVYDVIDLAARSNKTDVYEVFKHITDVGDDFREEAQKLNAGDYVEFQLKQTSANPVCDCNNELKETDEKNCTKEEIFEILGEDFIQGVLDVIGAIDFLASVIEILMEYPELLLRAYIIITKFNEENRNAEAKI